MTSLNTTFVSWKRRYEDLAIRVLRYSLAIIFIWFGVLKMANFNPVFDLVDSVTPFLAVMPGLFFLGLFETAIGIGLIVNRFRTITHLLLLFHLAGTFLTFVLGPQYLFTPHFPILSLAGEFVVKNLTLVVAGFVVLLHESHRARNHRV